MPRFLHVVVLALAGVLPASVFALGLGEISLQSALNQPFRAEIPVTSESADELSGLRVSLASNETFERFGLLRPRFLSDFEFRLVTGQGRSVIRVSSEAPVAEPFVTLLLEIVWSQGRLLREYTVLLDPPVFENVAPAASVPAAQPQPAVAAPAPAPTRQSAPAAQRSPLPATPGGSYGPVQRNDTLWGIASRVRPDQSVDLNQMMLAIYRANPEAFSGNINLLRAGAILRVPDSAELSAITRSEAFNEVRQQNNAWRGAPAAAAREDSARLRLVPPSTDSGAAGGQRGEQAAGRVGAPADPALASRVNALEAELAERERLLELRNQELSDLQNQLEQLRRDDAGMVDESPVFEPGITDTAEPVAEAEAPAAAADEVIDDSSAAAGGADDGEAAPAMPPAVSTAASESRRETSFFGELLGSIWLYVGIGAALLLALFVARGRRKAATADSDWDDLLDDTPVADEQGDTTRLSPPRETADETFVVEESHGGQDTDQLQGAVAAATMEMDRRADQETPLEKTLSSDAGIDLDQADPIAEAEFHMAYGLYDQAADLLQEALRGEPDRRDLRRKLIDVYFVWENRGGFLREAGLFQDQVGEGDNEWNKVLIMGKQLCPDEELFAGAPGPVSGDDAMDLALGDDLGGDVDLQLGDDDGGVDLDLSAIREGPDAEGLDFDFGDASEEDADLSPTLLDAAGDSPTVESPTVEAVGPDSPTLETPTIEQPMVEPTMETPTIEAAVGDFESGGRDRSDETAALDLDELGLDLEEFADIAGEADAGDEDLVVDDDDATLLASAADADALLGDVRQGLDSTAEVERLDIDFGSDDDFPDEVNLEATGEMPGITDEAGSNDEAGLDELTAALEKSTRRPGETGDTLEQPKAVVDDTAEQPRPSVGAEADDVTQELLSGTPDLGAVDLELEEAPETGGDDAPTGTMGTGRGRPEAPTQTEVGTKLDLARAYLDMGDPDGAKSILDEVVEEGDDAQRQEARQLLDQLTR